MKYEELVKAALDMRNYSYTPYSHFAVGAALLTKTGKIYTGCNVENAAYSPSICAERVAIFKAVSEGETEFEAIAIAGGKKGEAPDTYCPPCGVCRQVIREFCQPDFRILLPKSVDDVKEYTLKELLPEGFGPENVK